MVPPAICLCVVPPAICLCVVPPAVCLCAVHPAICLCVVPPAICLCVVPPAICLCVVPPAICLCVVPPAVCLCVVDTQDSRDLTAESEHNADFSKSKLHSSDIKELCLMSQMTAKDGMGYDLLTIKVYILKNPCMNQGVCEGPETDPNCTSTNRTTGGEITVPTFLIKYTSSSVRLGLAIVYV